VHDVAAYGAFAEVEQADDEAGAGGHSMVDRSGVSTTELMPVMARKRAANPLIQDRPSSLPDSALCSSAPRWERVAANVDSTVPVASPAASRAGGSEPGRVTTDRGLRRPRWSICQAVIPLTTRGLGGGRGHVIRHGHQIGGVEQQVAGPTPGVGHRSEPASDHRRVHVRTDGGYRADHVVTGHEGERRLVVTAVGKAPSYVTRS
jgi:hypothetical protein